MENNIEEEKSTTLFIPVGIGFGDDQDSNKSLAETLVFLIKDQNPDNIIFFTTDLSSKYTLNYIKDIYQEDVGHRLNNYTTIRIKDVDDFEEIFKKINKQIENTSNIIKIDYALCSFEEDVTLNQIFNKRMEVLSKRIQEIAQNIK